MPANALSDFLVQPALVSAIAAALRRINAGVLNLENRLADGNVAKVPPVVVLRDKSLSGVALFTFSFNSAILDKA